MIDRATLKTIRKVQLKMERLATDILAGMYRSAFKGKGMEFQEVRAFQPGDEVRSIDWNVTARMGSPYIKLFQEERELTVILMVDISASTRFGSVNQLKSQILSEIGAVLAFSGIKNRDRIGLLLFTDHIEHFLAPAKGVRHVLRLIRDLMAFPAQGKGTHLASALHYLGKVQKKRCVVFLLSDFLNVGVYKRPMSIIAKTHDLIAIAIQDPREQTLPDVGLLPLRDLETDETALIDTSSQELNPHLQQAMDERLREAKQVVEKSGASWLEVSTARSYVSDLKKFFRKRERIR
jgi:uncharacterized protein (DUF58 family)